MRALTVRQPWATAIIAWGKDVENRTRNVAGRYRGPVAIHAGLTVDDGAFVDQRIREALDMFDDSWRYVDHLDLVDVHGADWCWDPGGHCSRWGEPSWTDGCVTQHLVLDNPRPITEPIPCRGQLGLWTPPAEVLELLKEVG